MTHSAAYITPTGFMAGVTMLGGRFAQAWSATPIPADPSQELVVITWDNPNAEDEFEARPEVMVLGAPWEPLPDEAVPLIASMQDPTKVEAATLSASRMLDVPQPIETVHRALRKLPGVWGRMVR